MEDDEWVVQNISWILKMRVPSKDSLKKNVKYFLFFREMLNLKTGIKHGMVF